MATAARPGPPRSHLSSVLDSRFVTQLWDESSTERYTTPNITQLALQHSSRSNGIVAPHHPRLSGYGLIHHTSLLTTRIDNAS